MLTALLFINLRDRIVSGILDLHEASISSHKNHKHTPVTNRHLTGNNQPELSECFVTC